MIQHLIQHHVFLNPTLDFEWKGIIDRTPQFELEDQKLLYSPSFQYVPEDERLVSLGQYHWADERPGTDREQFLKGYKHVQEFLRKFAAAGGKLYSRHRFCLRQILRVCRCTTKCRFLWTPAFLPCRRSSPPQSGPPK